MTRLRIGFAITILLGAMYAAAGLFQSLTDLSMGVVVAMLGVIGLGAIDYLESRRDNRIYRERLAVWARRDS